jgi:Family of unknown function (DUF6088)
MRTINLIRAHINRLGPDAIFTSRDFLCYGKRSTIDSAVNRLIKKEMIVRVARGVFVRWSVKVMKGALPSALEVARAKCLGFGKAVFIHKKDAALQLGLVASGNESPTFSTLGNNTSFQYGEQRIRLVRVSPKDAKMADGFAGILIRALKQVGYHKEIASTLCEILGKTYRRTDRKEAKLAAAYLPSWASDHLLDGSVAGERVQNLTRIKKKMHKFLKGYQRAFMIERTISQGV